MKVSVYTNDLLEALKFVTKSAAVKPMNPITAAIKLDATDNMLTLSANNFTTAAWIKIPANAEESGAAAVDAKNFLSAVAKLGNDTLTIDTGNGVFNIHSGETDFRLNDYDANEFPAVTMPDNFPYEMRAKVFNELVQRTAFAVSNKDERPIFSGINLQFIYDNDTPKIIALASNTYHIARYQCRFIPVQVEGYEPFNAIVPAASLKIVADYLDPKDSENKIKFATDGKTMSFVVNNIYLQTRLIEGEFPPTDHMFAKDAEITMRFHRTDLKRALNAVSFVAAQSEHNAASYVINNGQLRVRAIADTVGEAETSIPIDSECDDFGIAFDGRFINAFLGAVGQENLVAEFTGKNAPVKMHAANDYDFDYICTPVRMYEAVNQ